MRRLVTSALCGILALQVSGTPSAEARSRSRARARSAAPARRTVEPPRAEPRRAEPRAATPAPRKTGPVAPRPREYRLAEPTPEARRRASSLALGGRILMVTGISLGGLGLVATITGAVLVSIAPGEGMQRIGVATLISGAAALACGTTLWAVGRWRANKAEQVLLDSRMRPYTLQDPGRKRPESQALALPTTHLVFSAQLRF